MTKFCTYCKKTLPLESFVKNNKRRDGRTTQCRECRNKWTEEKCSTPEHKIASRNYQRRWREKFPDKSIAKTKKWRENNRSKVLEIAAKQRDKDVCQLKARRAIAIAKKAGRIKPQPCEVCGESKTEAHHDNYDKPLEVRWMCKMHHSRHHRDLKYK